VGLIEAIVLGIVQGLTEFLPISSTAHIRIIPALMGWPDPGAAFTAAIQLGTLLAVLIYFRNDLARAFVGWTRGLRGGEAAQTPEARLGWAIAFGSIPIIVFGVLFKDAIETTLRSLYVICATLIGMGLLLWFAEKKGVQARGLDSVRPVEGLAVGLWQAVALIPGASRSGSTMTGALLAGFDRATAARFSFLLSVPSILAAGVYSLVQHRDALLDANTGLLVPVLVANAAAFVSGYWAIAFLIRFLQTRSVGIFVIYRVALGLALLGLLAGGVLAPDAGLPR
jgi:undecaprenyl-diphosphatase